MDESTNINALLDKWGNDTLNYLPNLFLALVVLVAFYFLAKIFRTYSLKFYSKIFKQTNEIAKLVSFAVYIFFLLSGSFIALEVLGLESVLAKLLAGAGIVGIVAGFAFKDIASNAFAGLLLNIQRPFKGGDWVSIDSNFGTIKEVGWITTSIKTVTGQEVFVPNQLIYNNTFTNYSTFNKRRVVVASGVSYGDDLELVKKVALDEIHKVASLLQEETVDFYFTGIGSSAYNFEIRFWIRFTHQKDYLQARSETIMRLKKRFEQEDISLAYSIMTLDFGVKGGVNIFDKPLQIEERG